MTVQNQSNLAKYITVITSLVVILAFSSSVKAADDSSCRDTIIHCWCSNGNQLCSHQLTDCSVPTETHNEMPGAAACESSSKPSALVSPIASSSSTLVVGVGGEPITSASPDVIASQTQNQAGELPKTGLPLGALALVGLAPLGFKLKSFSSKFSGSSDPSLIWMNKQLKK